jgi:hypothetical protein
MLRLAYGSLVIGARCADPAPLAWLREFLGGAFDVPSPSAPPDHTLALELGRAPPSDAPPADEIECFSLDGSFLKLPGRRAPDGSLRIRDDAESILYEIRGRDVTILAAADGPAVRLALLRVAREIATAHALAQGHVHLHAAAISVSKGVLAIAGPRGSGKTTLLLHALLAGGARYVTNDRLFVDLSVGPPLARGMPTIVSLREETIARFPAFLRRLQATAYARDRTLAEAEARRTRDWRPNLTPAQLVRLARAGEAGTGLLRAAVFPAVAQGIERFEVCRLGADDAASRLRQGIFLATLPERPAAAFAAGIRPRDGPEIDRLCRQLAARIPCLDVRVGPLAYEDAAIWDAILRHVP